MRKTLISYASAGFLCSAAFSALVLAEAPVVPAPGRVLGASEIFERPAERPRLTLSDVLGQDLPPLAPEAPPAADPAPRRKADAPRLALPAKAAIAIDQASGEELFAENADDARPVASISKLWAALVFLDLEPDLEAEYAIKASDYLPGGREHLAVGDRLRLRDLLAFSLIASDNTAARALAGAAGRTEEEFVALMNQKALDLGLRQTSFRDLAGFSPHNVSSAREIARTVREAFERAQIRDILALAGYECATLDGHKRQARSTNRLFAQAQPDGLRIIGGKTGYTEAAGNCFAGLFRLDGGHGVITVVLGAAQESERFRQSLALAQWAKDSHVWP